MPLIHRPTDAPGAAPASLASGSADERWTAARALAATAQGVQALAKALAGETDPPVREAIFTGLARIATPDSAAAVLPYLRSDDATLRTGALDALRAMPGAAKPHLNTLLNDPDADVRLLACEIVRNLDSTEATRLLCALIDGERETNVCASAVDVLAEIGTAEALPHLARCAERFKGDPFLGFSIKVATDRLRTARE
ncbi:MAG TPA: HEAT repeat domain-containing protein [Rhizomicrobium sp.]|jgi:HEAT repeat protein|nr:HEAT repeat domain-containing protein [Rhizomicrobium sp.]